MSKTPGDRITTYKSRKRRLPYIHNSLTEKKPKPDDDGLIKLPAPKLKSEKSKPNFEDIDKILEKEPSSDKSIPSLYLLLPSNILEGNLDAEKPVKEKYKDSDFPLPKSQKSFKRRIDRLLPVIPRILAGDEELSFYYTLALEQRKESPHKTMLSSEQENVEWKRYIGGFYGLKRQHFVSRLIMARYGDELRRLANKTIVYWGPETFSTYVLANELLLRDVEKQKGLKFAEAERYLKDSIEYGCYVADGVRFDDDIEAGDVLGGKDGGEGKD
ncbi:hypothetical protein C7M61_002623 [Candidozyma pseudohaemuli]|uniref:Restriction of telomere capping protein 4 n=1 Tax=Candidozyma pseudohaemuli TaxID=418784 RepID=A0A2P7YRU2_9ASCO|nr:hypothetical protein C7M61_002623 [[Candida] pseudohaemulonii]PSK38685.1 hypothetical protein C7M61_002623 [[Candida] pseudohaemulonii]